MFKLEITGGEMYNDKTNEFVTIPKCTISLEHSLVSISKWEAIHCKPFFNRKENKTKDELISYVKCMTLTPNVDDRVYMFISNDQFFELQKYIESPMTATTFSKENTPPSRQIITSELIYYSMIVNGIPFECQKWHINRLLTLIKVCNIKNGPQKKMSKSQIMNQNAQLNAARRAALHTRG